ncbi:alpha-L-rhamnosidase-related protein [Rhodocytophaga rosea]|uniref:alpha-L-rhamnosidase-related protein n=1 Tax=Rhodocytophaga rosea TaxID=2704465 RepID=UPI001E48C5F7|nr:glycogen debranching protein [Rhodocytophaga rosea]
MISQPKISVFLIILIGACLIQCKQDVDHQNNNLPSLMAEVESISGKKQYLASPFVTAGDRVYMVGHQDGQFPDLGWHVTGEMGGIWNHPIKLMDGFTVSLQANGQSYCLAQADTFVNYPFANKHIYHSTPAGIRVERFQFVPDSIQAILVEFTLYNESSVEKEIVFEFNGMVDLRPVWLGERTNMNDAGDFSSWDEATKSMVAKDSSNSWYVVYGSTLSPQKHQIGSQTCDFKRIGKGTNASLSYSLHIPPKGSISLPITIAGSYQSLEDAKAAFEKVQKNPVQLLQQKKARYATIAQTAQLTIPDKNLEQAFRWVKYNTDWLVRDVPETGRGLTAGLPDYPWWFGADSEYALQGAIATGRKDLVYQTIDALYQISENANGNGRIIHEVSTNGAVFNPGNINETPQFASLIWFVYQWTGDKAFLQKYYPVVKKGLDWLLRENDTDKNLLPDGFGMMEIHGLNSEMIDVAVYTQKAFANAAQMAELMGEKEIASSYRNKADTLRKKINSEFWVPEANSYADFVGTATQASHLINDAIVRADTLKKPWAVKELQETKNKVKNYPATKKQGFVLHHNWVVNTPMETGIADTSKALSALETGSQFVNPYGMFVTGIDRDESAGKDESSFAAGKKIFSYTGAVMTLPTGVQAISENNYGRPDKALDYLQRMTKTFGYAFRGLFMKYRRIMG